MYEDFKNATCRRFQIYLFYYFCEHLGLKEAEDEVEKFVQANTQEVAKDKWQCPLCGKKFKAAEFVHKHILHKHAEKVKEVKKEVRCTSDVALCSYLTFNVSYMGDDFEKLRKG